MVEEDVERKETQVRSAKQHYYSLRSGRIQAALTSAEERMNYLQRELDRFGNTEEEDDLREAWINNSGQIRSIYSQMEQEWQVEEEKLRQELAAHSEYDRP